MTFNETHHARSDEAAGPTPQFETETKLMQHYRTATAAHGGGALVTVLSATGGVEIFTTGTDGSVWNFFPDPDSDTGYRSVVTKLKGQNIAAAVDGQGRIVVLAGDGLTVGCIASTGDSDPEKRWSEPKVAATKFSTDIDRIEKIMMTRVGGDLYAAIIGHYLNSGISQYVVHYCLLNVDADIAFMNNFPRSLNISNCVWTGTDAGSLGLTVLDTGCMNFNLATQAIKTSNFIDYPPFVFPPSTAVVHDSGGIENYFTVMSTEIMQYRSDDAAYGWSSLNKDWPRLTPPPNFRAVQSLRAADGRIHLFGLTDRGLIYHIEQQADGAWSPPDPLQQGVAAFSACLDAAGDFELILVAPGAGDMRRLTRDSADGDWRTDQIEVPSSTEIEMVTAYATDVTISVADGAPAPNAVVEIRASREVDITIDGAVHRIDPSKAAVVRTSGVGRLSVAQPTESLGAATLTFRMPDLAQHDLSVAIRQYAGVEKSLAAVDDAALLAAKDASGAELLKGKSREGDTPKDLAKNIRACMSLVGSTQLALRETGVTLKARKHGVGVHRVTTTDRLDRLAPTDEITHWRARFDGASVTYEELAPQVAQAMLIDAVTAHARSSAIDDFGDLIASMANGLAKAAELIVTSIGNEIRVAITFITDGVTYVLDRVISAVSQLFDLVEVLFARVEATFQQIAEWIGFVFDWDDILRTHEAIAHSLREMLGFLPLAAAGLQARFDQGIDSALREVDAAFDSIIAGLDGGSLGDAYGRRPAMEDDRLTSGMANNQFLDATLNARGPGIAKFQAHLAASRSKSFDDVMTKLQELATKISALPEFGEVGRILGNLHGDITQILNQIGAALLRLLQGVVKAALLGVQTVVDAVIALAAELVQSLLGILETPIELPLVSSFYESLTNSKLTLLDLAALLIAIPTTIIAKVITNAAPFPDQAHVDEFKAAFDRHSLLAHTGLGPVGAELAEGLTVWQEACRIINGITNWIFYWLSMAPDRAPVIEGAEPNKADSNLCIMAFVCEIVSAFFGCPCWFKPGLECEGEKALWIHGLGGIFFDACFLAKEHTLPENDNGVVGPVVATIWGVSRAILLGAAAKQLSWQSNFAHGAEIFVACAKIVRFPGIAKAYPVLLPALSVADFVAGPLISILSAFDPPTVGLLVHGDGRRIPGAVPRAV